MSITITQMIVHDMNFTSDKPKLAPDIMNLNTVPEAVFDFFTSHIDTSRNARQIKACVFDSEQSMLFQNTKDIYQDLNDRQKFIDITKDLTNDLFNKTKNAGSRSDGAVFFLLYKHDKEQFLGILKMDPNEGIQIDTDTFTLKVQENMLPNPKDKLHKCAFIKYTKNFSDEVHLYVLDRQQRAGEVSKYFIETFLNASEILNNKIMTERVTSKLREEIIPIIPQDDRLGFEFLIDSTFSNGANIDLDHDLERLVSPYLEEAEQEDFIDNFKRDLRDEYDDVNYQFTAEKEPAVVEYSSNGIKFEFPIEFLGNYVTIDDTETDVFTIKIRDIYLERKLK